MLDLKGIVYALASLVLLNASLTFGNVWPTPRIQWESALSVELAVCVLFLAAAHRWRFRLWRASLAAVWVMLIIGHYVDVTAPGLYGREFNLYWDSRHLSNVAAMLIRDVPFGVIALAVGVVALTIAAACVLARLALRSVAAAMEKRVSRRILSVTAGVLVVLFTGQQVSDRFPFHLPFADPVTASYLQQARFVAAMAGPGTIAPALDPSPAFNLSLQGLDGADVVLIFGESYGAVTYETPAFFKELAASRARLEEAVRASGRHMVSAYVESPTFGGSSWLAHLSLISGVEVRDEYANASLMSQRRDTLVTTFARNNYRTVAMMPGIRQEWPEGAFYGFDVIYNHDLLQYDGPKFGWWSIPDQFTLAKLDALELDRPSRAPVFAIFPTSTTHAPFGPVAPYQPDWPRVLTKQAYDSADVESALGATPDLTNLSPSYLRAMSYQFDSLAGYVREHANDNLVMIVIGDHQPPAAVSGRNASWDVPVHVIASSSHLLDRLITHGFRPGIEPGRPSMGRMHELVPVLLEAFDSPPSAQAQ